MFINQFHYRDREREKKGALCVEVVRARVLFVSSALPVSVCTSVKYTDYISGPFSPSVCLPVTPPHPPVRRLDRTSLTHGARLVSLVSSSSPLSPSLPLSHFHPPLPSSNTSRPAFLSLPLPGSASTQPGLGAKAQAVPCRDHMDSGVLLSHARNIVPACRVSSNQPLHHHHHHHPQQQQQQLPQSLHARALLEKQYSRRRITLLSQLKNKCSGVVVFSQCVQEPCRR